MTSSLSAQDPGVLRMVVGWPTRWRAALEFAFGVMWLVLALSEGFSPMRVICFAFWLTLGVAHALVAISDRRHHRGRYAGR